MTDPVARPECAECGAPVWWNPASLEYRHKDDRLDDTHRPWVKTNSYLDDPGMRAAHLRSMGR